MSKKKANNKKIITITIGFEVKANSEDEPSWVNQNESDEVEENITSSTPVNNYSCTVIGFKVHDNNSYPRENQRPPSKKTSALSEFLRKNIQQDENQQEKENTITQSAPSLQIIEEEDVAFYFPNSVTNYDKKPGSKIPPRVETELYAETSQTQISQKPISKNKIYASSAPINIDYSNSPFLDDDEEDNPLSRYFSPKIQENVGENEYITVSGSDENPNN